MGAFRFKGNPRGIGGATSGWLAVVLALLVVGSEIPWTEPYVREGRAATARPAILSLLGEGKRALERELVEAWSRFPGGIATAVVRARLAGQAAQEAVAARFPLELEAGTVDWLAGNVSIGARPSAKVPGNLEMEFRGRITARDREGEVVEDVHLSVEDPWRGAPTEFLDGVARWLSEDPRSPPAIALRSRLPALLAREPSASPESVTMAVAQALDEAARFLNDEWGPGIDPTVPTRANGWAPERLPSDPRSALRWVDDANFSICLQAWLEGRPFQLARTALLAAARQAPTALLTAATALLDARVEVLEELLNRLPGFNASVAGEAAAELRAFLRDLADRLDARAQESWRGLRQLVPPLHSTAPVEGPASILLRPTHVRVEWGAGQAPLFGRGGPLRPFVARGRLVCDLQIAARLGSAPEPGPLETRDVPLAVDFTVFSASPVAGVAYEAAAFDPSFPLLQAAAASDLVETLGFVEEARREVDLRLQRFADHVTRRVEESSATGFSRLVFRILDGLAEGNRTLTDRAVFEFLERYIADDLRDALTVNFTLFGVELSLVPDPVRQQISIEHREGPHTFGVRVRRVVEEGDPLKPKWSDHYSLALEFFWSYASDPVEASLVLDPFLRTDEGLLRFRLRSLTGEGTAISVEAPRIVRREGVFELALSSLIPGGVPVAVTPAGVLVTVDAGARVVVAAVRLPTVARWLLRALEGAWLDTVANQTVREVDDQAGAWQTAHVLVGRFLNRLADTAAVQASRLIPEVEVFARVAMMDAAGVLAAGGEVALTVREPAVVFRESASALAQLFREATTAVRLDRPAPPGLLDVVPAAIQERVGVTARFRLGEGFGGLLDPGGGLGGSPSADLSIGLFLSCSALSTLIGRSGVHTVSEVNIRWEGLGPAVRRALPWWRLAPADALDLVWLRAESLSGPKILISEVAPAPRGADADLEFAELYNPGYAEEELTGWSLRDASGRSWTLPDGLRIAAGATLVLARSAGPFLRWYGVAPDAGTLTLSLNDDGDRVQLINSRGVVSDEVAWGVFARATASPDPGWSLARGPSSRPPVALPGSALNYTGSELDFARAPATPGALPVAPG